MRRRLAHVFAGPVLALLALAPGLATPALAQDAGYVVVVNAANPTSSLPRQQLADIFMKRATQWPHGGDAHPVDLPAVSSVRDAFSRAVHGRPGSAVASYWGQQLFSGRGTPPPQRPNDRAVLQFVAGDAAAVGYVSPGAATPDLKVLRITP